MRIFSGRCKTADPHIQESSDHMTSAHDPNMQRDKEVEEEATMKA